MPVSSDAVCGDITRSTCSGWFSSTVLPPGETTRSTIHGRIRTPPFAIVADDLRHLHRGRQQPLLADRHAADVLGRALRQDAVRPYRPLAAIWSLG